MSGSVRFRATVKDVMRATRCGETTVRGWVRCGLVLYKRLPGKRGRGALRIAVDAQGFPVRRAP